MTHRWVSLVLGLFLIVEVVTGDALLWQPELLHLANSAAYSPSHGQPQVSASEALRLVQATHAAAGATSAWTGDGLWLVTGDESWTVDQSTGRILGEVVTPAWLQLLENVHECAFTCTDDIGHLQLFDTTVPGTQLLSGTSDPLPLGGLALGGLGVVLTGLTIGGIWLWFPRPSRWRSAVTIRWRGGRFKRDSDLHKVIGVLAMLPLLIWGITGIGFEYGGAEGIWDAISPGDERTDPQVVASGSTSGPPLDADAAVAAALNAVPGTTLASLTQPDTKARDAAYDIWLSTDHDPSRLTDYPGDVEVSVVKASGEATITYGWPTQPLGQTVWAWSYPVHSGYVVNGWWRIAWLGLGLVPLLLAVTGVSTWLIRRRSARSRRSAKRARSATSATI